MRVVIVIALLSAIATSISLYCVINQKNHIIENQVAQQVESQKKIKTYQTIISSDKQTSKQQIDKLNLLNTELKQAKDANKHLKYIGRFLITYYDLSYESCNKYPNDPAYGHTYSGAIAKEGVTIAVDKSIIPLGSYVYINQTGCRIAEDIGGAIKGNHIDVFVQNFSYKKYKTHYSDVYLIQ